MSEAPSMDRDTGIGARRGRTRVLVTGSRSTLGRALVRALATSYNVRSLDLQGGAEGSGPAPDVPANPRDREAATAATDGCDAVVPLLPLAPPGAPPHDVIDAAVRS